MSLIFFNPRYAYFVVKNVLSLITIKLNNTVFSLNHLYFPKYVFLRKTETRFCRGRSSHQRCSIKIGVPRNFTKFTGKHLCQSLFFNKVAGPRPATLWNKRLWYRCFPVNFMKFLRTPFYKTRLDDCFCRGESVELV